MSRIEESETTDAMSMVPARPIVARIRRLILTAGIAAAVYAIFTTGSKGYCPTPEGAVDPSCISLTLQPSGLVYMAIFAIVVVNLNFVLRRAHTVESALRYLDRAAAIIAILVVASALISQIWFWMIPITDWDGTGTFFYPFPFGAVDLVTTPLNTQ